MDLRTPLGRFRLVVLAEGVSYLLLLFVAMPLKYLAGLPAAVRVVGGVHGGLFLLFVLLLAQVWVEYGWPLRRAAWAFALSIVPFGNFVLDRALARHPQV